MPERLYIETSVPSAYVSGRTDPSSLHRRTETREWWDAQRILYDCFVSESVLLELSEGDWPGKVEALSLLRDIPILPGIEEVRAVASRCIAEKLVPDDLGGDA